MRRTIIKSTAWGLVAVLGLVLLGTGGMLWRLSVSPLQVSFLLPYLQSSLVDPASGYALQIDSAAVTWDRRDHSLVIQAGRSVLRRTDGPLILNIPSTSIRLDFPGLLIGEVRPSRIVVDGIWLALDVDEAGRIGISSGEDTEQRSESLPVTVPDLWAALDGVLTPKDPASPFRSLQSVVVRDGHLTVSDRRQPAPWSANIARLEIDRDDTQLDGSATLSLQPAGQAEPFAMQVRLRVSPDTASGDVTFRDFNAARLLAAYPGAAMLRDLDTPLGGTLTLEFDRSGGTQRLGFDLHDGQGGTFSAPALPKPLPLRSAALRGQVDLASGVVHIESARIETALSGAKPTKLDFSGLVTPGGAGTAIDGKLTVEALSVADLKAYWPAADHSAIRQWLDKNVDRGVIERAAVTARLAAGADTWTVANIAGSVAYRDVAVRVSPKAPLLIIAAGTADITKDAVRVSAPRADLGPLAFTATTATIGGLPAGPLRADVTTKFSTSIAETLAMAARLEGPQASQLPFPAADLAGRLSADVKIAFPLNAPVSLRTAKVSAHGTIADGSVRKAILGKDITGADLTYRFDGTHLDMSGKLTFAGAPATVEAHQVLRSSGGGETEFKARLPDLTPRFWAGFGVDLAPVIQGSHSAVINGTIRPDKVMTVDTAIDLRQARLALPMLNWTKPAGAAGTLRSTAVIGRDGRAEVKRFTIVAGDLSARGTAEIAFNGRADIAATIADFKLRRTHLQTVSLQARDDRLSVRVGAGVLDLSGTFGASAGENTSGPDATTPGMALDDLPFATVAVEAPALRRVYFADDRYLENVLVSLSRTGGRWRSAHISAAVPGTEGPYRALLLNYGPRDGGGMALRVHAADLGAALKAMDIADGVRGGQLDVAARSRPDDPEGPVVGRFEATDVTVTNMPVLAEILAVDSLVNFRKLFEGEGITFSEMNGDLTLAGDTVKIENLRATGGSLAVTADGTYDPARDTVAFKGYVVPARRINELIGKIPVLGSVLTGANKEGIVAVSFSVGGRANDPKVSVHPGSALTPGILRDIFGGILN